MKMVGDRYINAFTQISRKYELFYNDKKPENKGWDGGKVYKSTCSFLYADDLLRICKN